MLDSIIITINLIFLQVKATTDVESLRELLSSSEYDFRYDIGISQPVSGIRFFDKEKIVSLMAKHYVILNVKAELDQILCGMSSTLNVLQLVRENPSKMWPMFVHTTPEKVTWDKVLTYLRLSCLLRVAPGARWKKLLSSDG